MLHILYLYCIYVSVYIGWIVISLCMYCLYVCMYVLYSQEVLILGFSLEYETFNFP